MKRKRSLILMMTLLLVVEGVNAQKIDQRLTRLIEQVNARRAQGQRPVNAEAVNKTMVVDFNADGSVRAFSAIATLKDGAEWPTSKRLMSAPRRAWMSMTKRCCPPIPTMARTAHIRQRQPAARKRATAYRAWPLRPTLCIETMEAGGHREATPATMYSVDAPVYNMMGQRVNKSQKGLVIYKGRKYVNK